MTLPNPRPRESAETRRQSLIRAKLLLEEALQHIDNYADAPEVGARLDEILARLKERLAEPLDVCVDPQPPTDSTSERLG